MEPIDIGYGLSYDPKLPWYKQDKELIQFALNIMNTQKPKSAEVEPTLDGGFRIKEATWELENNTTFAVIRYFKYPPDHPAWATKEKADNLIIISEQNE